MAHGNLDSASPRIMTMLHEPGAGRYFAINMNGRLYAISSDGKTVTLILDLTASDGKSLFMLRASTSAMERSGV